jgi:hypothetical protein
MMMKREKMKQISLSMTGYFDKGKKTQRERPFGDGIDRGHSDVMGVIRWQAEIGRATPK